MSKQNFRIFYSLFSIFLSITEYNCDTDHFQPPRYLNFGFLDLSHSIVENTTKTYQKMRDLHHDLPDILIPLVIFAKEISDALNSTLHTIPNYQYRSNFKKAVPGYPTMLFQLYITQNITFKRTWLKYVNTRTGKMKSPNFAVSITLPLNFAYCDAPRKKFESPWKITIFTDSFDCYFWLLFLLFLTLNSYFL